MMFQMAREDSTYHSLCGALAGTRNSSMDPPRRIDTTTHHTMSKRSYHITIILLEFSRSYMWVIMKSNNVNHIVIQNITKTR